MIKYDSRENLATRIQNMYYFGHDSSVWSEYKPPKKGHVVEIVAPCYVSKPCWNEMLKAATHIDTIEIDFGDLTESVSEPAKECIYQFFFFDIEVARTMALRVQKSASNIRKDFVRRTRLEEAGGFHNKFVLDRLFKIQHGRCYYSGDALTITPKNYVIDHILSIYSGGTNWPYNLALVIKEINTWKGGHASSKDTLLWLAKSRGTSWLQQQKAYCKEVDRKREELDREFKLLHTSS